MEMQRYHPLATLQDAANLYNRYQAGAGFRAYVRDRSNLVIPMLTLVVLAGVTCTAGMVVYLAGARAYLMLFVLLLAPFMLIGSLLLQAYLFFGWLENRALAKGLKHALEREGPVKRWLRKNVRAQMGTFPPLPWIFVAVLLLAPLVMTAAVMPKLAATLVAVYAGAVILFARLDD